jgi:hypothetical protein
MSMKWIAIGLSVCAAAQIALLIWGRHVRPDVLPMLRVTVAVALVGLVTPLRSMNMSEVRE